MSDESTTVLQWHLERAVTGDAEARQRLLELTRDRLMRHARSFLHGRSGGGVGGGHLDHLDRLAEQQKVRDLRRLDS